MHDADCIITMRLPGDYAAQTRAYFQPGARQVLVEQRVLDCHYQPLDGEASTYHTSAPCGARTEVERMVRPLHTHWIAGLHAWLAARRGEEAPLPPDSHSASLPRLSSDNLVPS